MAFKGLIVVLPAALICFQVPVCCWAINLDLVKLVCNIYFLDIPSIYMSKQLLFLSLAKVQCGRLRCFCFSGRFYAVLIAIQIPRASVSVECTYRTRTAATYMEKDTYMTGYVYIKPHDYLICQQVKLLLVRCHVCMDYCVYFIQGRTQNKPTCFVTNARLHNIYISVL